jgi:hypothetical protein
VPTALRLWQIHTDQQLEELYTQSVDLEKRLENWLSQDIRLLASDILVIGKKVQTSFGGIIDLLGIDRQGDIILIEFRKDRSPKVVTADILEHASWVREQPHEFFLMLGGMYYETEEAFREQFISYFQTGFPDLMNRHHRMIIVGTDFDRGAERIIQYLSRGYGLHINVVMFSYYPDPEGTTRTEKGIEGFLAKTTLLEENILREQSKQPMNTQLRMYSESSEQGTVAADEHGVGVLWETVMGLQKYFDQMKHHDTHTALLGYVDSDLLPILTFYPGDSSKQMGLYFQIELTRFNRFFQVQDERDILHRLTDGFAIEGIRNQTDWYGGYIRTTRDADELLSLVARFNARKLRNF